jgi:hypothetical protein
MYLIIGVDIVKSDDSGIEEMNGIRVT